MHVRCSYIHTIRCIPATEAAILEQWFDGFSPGGSQQVEWHIPDRRLAIGPDNDLVIAAQRLIEFTRSVPNLTLEFEPAARDLFDSFCVMFNTRCNKLRKAADADAAAEEGVTGVLPC